jgi:hypothetical protein
MSSTVSELLAGAQAGAMNDDQPESDAGGDRSLFRLLLEIESSLRKQARAECGMAFARRRIFRSRNG